MCRILGLIFVFFSGSSLYASGLDLSLIYGSKYVGMGGQQIALANDAYAPFYNPAGMIAVEKATFALNSSPLMRWYGAPVGGPNPEQRNSGLNFGPLFYAGGVYRLTDRVALGLAIYPTALQGGRFSNVDYGTGVTDKEFSNRLYRIEVAPSIALKVIDNLSIGLSYRIGWTRYEKALGTFESSDPAGAATFFDTSMQEMDAKGVKISAFLDDFYGFNLALSYRFKMRVTLTGDTSLETTTGSRSFPTRQRLSIPAQVQAGVAYKELMNGRLHVALAYEYTGNSIIREDSMTVTGLGAALGTGTDEVSSPLNWKDGHTFHLGGSYRWPLANRRHVSALAGLAYDRAVTRVGKPLPAVAPAADYIGIAAGGQFGWSSHLIGLALNYGEYSRITGTVDTADGVNPLIVSPGEYSLKSFLATVDYQYKF